MKISKRLKSIGDLIPDNSFILDIGCDHALLDIYICQNKNCKAIASDINEKPLEQARKNVNKYKLNDKIKIVQGDGLEHYEEKINIIVLSGLGSTTIVDILKKDKEKLKEINKLIISSNNDYYYLRSNIIKLGYKITKELVIKDKEKYYPIIEFTKGNKKYNKYELKYGPIILKTEDNIIKEYLELNKNKLLKINNSLTNKYLLKKIKIKKEINYLKKYFQKYYS